MPFEKFFAKKESPQVTERILPSDVRYALEYKEAKLGISEMRDLIENGFTEEALYMILKGASEDPALQLELLQGLVDLIVAEEEEGKTPPMPAFLRNALSMLHSEVKVEAQKLALISRIGFTQWHTLYEDTAQKLATEDVPVFLLAHATFVGLASFVRAFHRGNKPLYILVPDFFGKEGNEVCGYVIKDGVVSFLPKDFARLEDAVIVDDVRNTGATADVARSFWMQKEAAPEPSFKALYETGS